MIIKAISEKFNHYIFDFKKEFRNQLINEDDDLTKKIKLFLDSGNIIPSNLIEKFLKNKFNEIESPKILLTGFPTTIDQFLILENIMECLKIEFETIWYVRQNNPEDFMKEYFKDPKQKCWTDKFGEESIENWKERFSKIQIFITEIQKIILNTKWNIIEIDYEIQLDEKQIITKIND